MKTFDGYKKRNLTDDNVLLAGGGHKSITDLLSPLGDYVLKAGDTMTGDLYINAKLYGPTVGNNPRNRYDSGLYFFNCNNSTTSAYNFGLYLWNDEFQFTYRTSTNNLHLGNAFTIQGSDGQVIFTKTPKVGSTLVSLDGHTHSFTLGTTPIITGGTYTAIAGPFTIYTNATTNKALSICRGGAEEGVKHWVDDSLYHIDYTNDETSSSIHIRIINTDIESGNKTNTTDYHYFLDCYGNFHPGSNNTGSIGTADYKWTNMYATTFHGGLDGTATLVSKSLKWTDAAGTALSYNGGTEKLITSLSFPYNQIALNFRHPSDGYATKILYMTAGNEALVFATQSSVTSFIFKSGANITNSNLWYDQVPIPTLLLKGLSAYINKLIADGSAPEFNFLVNGSSRFDGKLWQSYSTRVAPNADYIRDSAIACFGEYNDDAMWIGNSTDNGTWILVSYMGASGRPSKNHPYNLSLLPLSGKVGIGTLSPTATLQVNGDTIIGSKSKYYQRSARGQVHHEFVCDDSDYGGVKITHNATEGSGSPGSYTASLFVLDNRPAHHSGTYLPTVYIQRAGATRTMDPFGIDVGGSRIFTIDNSGNSKARSFYNLSGILVSYEGHTHAYLPTSGANYNTNSNSNLFRISRGGNNNECLSIGVDDQTVYFNFMLDENVCRYRFQGTWDGSENPSAYGSGSHYIDFMLGADGPYINIESLRVLTSSNWSNWCAAASHTHSQYLTLHLSLSDRLYTFLTSLEQNTDPYTWIRKEALNSLRGHCYNTSGLEWQYLWGISSGKSYGNIIRATYGDGNPYIQIMGLYSGNWTTWRTVCVLDGSNNLTISGSYYANSDIRYKLIQSLLLNKVNSIAELPIFTYYWNDDLHDNKLHIGSSAQAVKEILPELVTYDESKDFYNLDYATLGTIAGITACKELVNLKSEIDLLKERIKELELQLKMINDYGRC